MTANSIIVRPSTLSDAAEQAAALSVFCDSRRSLWESGAKTTLRYTLTHVQPLAAFLLCIAVVSTSLSAFSPDEYLCETLLCYAATRLGLAVALTAALFVVFYFVIRSWFSSLVKHALEEGDLSQRNFKAVYVARQSNNLCLLAYRRAEQQVVGLMCLLTGEDANKYRFPGLSPLSPREGLIEHVGVSSGCQGMGIGGKLLRECEAAARQKGLERLRLTTTTIQAAAVAMYRKHGYRIETAVPIYPFLGVFLLCFAKDLASQ